MTMPDKTVAELARELEITTQAVYKKINRLKREVGNPILNQLTNDAGQPLKPFNDCLKRGLKGETLIDEDGQQYISALCQPVDNQTAESCQPDTNQLPTDCQSDGNQFATSYQPIDNPLIEQLTRHIEDLQAQNALLIEQNQHLTAELSMERQHSRSQQDQTSALSQQMLEITRNNQVLLRQSQELLALQAPREEKKKSLFSRLFGGDKPAPALEKPLTEEEET